VELLSPLSLSVSLSFLHAVVSTFPPLRPNPVLLFFVGKRREWRESERERERGRERRERGGETAKRGREREERVMLVYVVRREAAALLLPIAPSFSCEPPLSS